MSVCVVFETNTLVIELRKAVFALVGAATVTGSILSNNTSHVLIRQWNIRRSLA